MNNNLEGNIRVRGAALSTVYHQRIKTRMQKIEQVKNEIESYNGPLQLMYDGKKVNGRERMVVLDRRTIYRFIA